MAMFDDLQERIHFLRGDANREVTKIGEAALAKAAARGVLGLGMLPIHMLDEAEPVADRLLVQMLLAYDTAIKRDPVAEPAFVTVVDQALDSFYANLPGNLSIVRLNGTGQIPAFVLDECARRRDRAGALFNQHRKGFEVGQPSAEIVNQITMHSSNAVIQQGGSGNTQHAAMNVNLPVIRDAFTTLNDEIRAAQLPDPIRDQLVAELDTAAPQLAKQSPSAVVLQEVVRSLRSIAEGVAAGLLTPAAIAALTAASNALGIS